MSTMTASEIRTMFDRLNGDNGAEKKRLVGIIGLLYVVLVIPSIVFDAYVGTLLWKWFVVPTFALPPLKVVMTLGLMITAKYFFSFRPTPHKPADTDSSTYWAKAMGGLLGGPLVLLMGWIITLFL